MKTPLLLTMLALGWASALAGETDGRENYEAIVVEAPYGTDTLRIFHHPQQDFPITHYGAVGDGEHDNTEAFARAIAECHRHGGGRVVVPAGTWLTGPIHFKSNVELHLAEGSVLRFYDEPQRYLPAVKSSLEGMEFYNYSPLIYAYECENIAITGTGVISPRMDTWKVWFPRKEGYMKALEQLYMQFSQGGPVEERQMADEANRMRPYLIHFNRCRNIRLEDFKIRESPFWCIHLFLCREALVRGVDVKAHGHNNDGIDIEMTQRALVEQCTFDQGDDAIVIKAGRNQDGWRLDTPCERVVVRHCTVKKGHSMLGIGSELSSGIRDIYLHDCTAPQSVMRFIYIKTNHRRGGFVENIYVKDVKAGATSRVFEIDTDVLYQWSRFPTFETRITRIANINVDGVACDSANAVYEIKGDERLPVDGVLLRNIRVGRVKDFVGRVTNAVNVREENLQISSDLGIGNIGKND